MLLAAYWIRDVLIALFRTEVRAWYGLESLGKVFWGYGVLASTVICGLYVLALLERRIIIQQLLLILFVAYTIFILVSVWRCAAAAAPFWQALARGLTVAWAANASLTVLFLELDLLGQYVRL